MNVRGATHFVFYLYALLRIEIMSDTTMNVTVAPGTEPAAGGAPAAKSRQKRTIKTTVGAHEICDKVYNICQAASEKIKAVNKIAEDGAHASCMIFVFVNGTVKGVMKNNCYRIGDDWMMKPLKGKHFNELDGFQHLCMACTAVGRNT